MRYMKGGGGGGDEIYVANNYLEELKDMQGK